MGATYGATHGWSPRPQVLIGALCWWAVGYAFAHGENAAGGFIG